MRDICEVMLWLFALLACDTPATSSATPDSPIVAPAAGPVPAPSVPMTEEGLLIPQPLGPDAPNRISARHILITFEGALNAQNSRPRAQALTRVRGLLTRLRAEEIGFDALAVEASEGPTRVLGGHLGAFERGVMHTDFEKVAFSLAENEISAIVETPFGFHIIQRLPLEEIRVAHVLIQWNGVPRSTVKRSKEAAEARAGQALERLQGGEPFSDVAKALSDGPTGSRGGELGWFQRGQMVPAFDEIAFALQPGETSPIVETPLGLHIITRLE